jgi:large subunit ribosomal protein L28
MTTIKGVQIGAKLSVNFMTNMQKLHRGLWPWDKGLKSRLPLHYKKRYVETWMREPTPVHYRAQPHKYVADKFGMPLRTQDVPIPTIFPREADTGLWGGEGFVAGFKKKHNDELRPRVAKVWKPYLMRRVFYSEILNQHFDITVTRRALDLVDDAFGFDNYILKTHEVDLKSKLGMTLKRQMLLALVRKSMYPDDPKKRDEIYAKYEKFVIPEEEAEWVGLTLYEAEQKLNEIEEAERSKNIRPLREVYADELLAELRENEAGKETESSSSWLKKLSPFQSEKK